MRVCSHRRDVCVCAHTGCPCAQAECVCVCVCVSVCAEGGLEGGADNAGWGAPAYVENWQLKQSNYFAFLGKTHLCLHKLCKAYSSLGSPGASGLPGRGSEPSWGAISDPAISLRPQVPQAVSRSLELPPSWGIPPGAIPHGRWPNWGSTLVILL